MKADLDDLVREFKDRVYNTALSFLRNVEDAEDIAQEVFVEAWRSVDKFEGRSTLATWLYRITVRKCQDLVKSRKRKKRFANILSLFVEGDEERFHPVELNHPGVQLADRERAKILFEAIDRLPEKQRVAFTLHNMEDLSYQEIAAVMQTSVPAVESLIFRARQELRRLLHDYYKGSG